MAFHVGQSPLALLGAVHWSYRGDFGFIGFWAIGKIRWDWPRRIARRHCGQSILATACGYEDCNDLDRTRLWTIFMPKGAASEVI
jgi:hypothetical protein